MISPTMKQSGGGKPTMQSIEEEATQPLGASPPSLYLFVCLLLAATFSRRLFALASCISAQRSSSRKGLHWTRLCPYSQTYVSNGFPASFLSGDHLLALTSNISHSASTPWLPSMVSIHEPTVLALSSVSCPHALNLVAPKFPKKGLTLCCSLQTPVENSSRGLFLVLWHRCSVSN